jgi:hypothetical protein
MTAVVFSQLPVDMSGWLPLYHHIYKNWEQNLPTQGSQDSCPELQCKQAMWSFAGLLTFKICNDFRRLIFSSFIHLIAHKCL